MDNNEILEINKRESELNEKLQYINGTIEQYKKQLTEYKQSHKEEFENENTQITDIHAVGSINALKIEIEKRDTLQQEKNEIDKIRQEEKKHVQESLDYVQSTIEQYKKQLREYKESHKEEFKDAKTPITDIHAIGSIKALKIELNKEKELKEKMELLNFDGKSIEENNVQNEEVTKQETNKVEIEEKNEKQDIEEILNEEQKVLKQDVEKLLDEDKTVIGNMEFTKAEMDSFILKDGQEKVNSRNIENSQIEEKENNESVKIIYSAKEDAYLLEYVETGKTKLINRKSLIGMDKELLAQKYGKDIQGLNNLDTNILEVLEQYDKENGTTKMAEYFDKVTTIGKSKQDRKDDMEQIGVEISYDLRGLYDNIPGEEFEDVISKFSPEERKEILGIANNAKSKGIANVKKGIKVIMRELADKISQKIKSTTLLGDKKTLKLPESKKEQRKNEEYDKLVNKEYMKSLDEDYEKALKEEKSKQFKDKIKLKLSELNEMEEEDYEKEEQEQIEKEEER